MENCIFCRIVKGEVPSYKVWEDNQAVAFLTVRPHKIGHVLLIPKKHEDYFFDLDDGTIKDLAVKAKQIAKALKKAFNPRSGKISMFLMGMGVPHVHIHLLPLEKETDLNPEIAYDASKEELRKAQEKIKSVLDS